MDAKLLKSKERKNIIMNKNIEKEIKSERKKERSGKIERDKEIEEIKKVLEDGNDFLIIKAWEDFEKIESNKKKNYKTEDCNKELKIETKKRKEDYNEKKNKKPKDN